MTDAEDFAPLTAQELQDSCDVVDNRKVVNDIEILIPIPVTAGDVREFAGRVTGLRGHPDLVWPYRDASGSDLFHVGRWNFGTKKEIRPLCWARSVSGEHWISRHFPTPRPLYGLDRLALAQDDAPIVVVEGEKTAEAARAVFPRSVVMTSAGGSGAAEKTDWSPLAGRQVLIWPDCDEPGRHYAKTVTRLLTNLNCIVRVVRETEVAGVTFDGGVREPVEGWDAADAVTEGWDVAALRQIAIEHSDVVTEAAPKFLSWGPYNMTADGLFAEKEVGRGENKSLVWLKISAPFEVIGRARDVTGSGWSRLLRWRDEDGVGHTTPVSDAEMHTDATTLAARLADNGLMISPNAASRASIADYLSGAMPRDRITVVHRTGWHEIGDRNVFVLPGHTYGRAGEPVILQGAHTAQHYTQSGSLDDWRQHVSALASGHKRAVLAISTALAGALLGVFGFEGGGIHYVGPSSKGKSTLIHLAASVWGRPTGEKGFVRTWRATANALESLAAIHTDTLLPLDELGQIDAYEAGAAVYALATGVGKGRAGRTGEWRPAKSWRVMVMSTGEIGLGDKIAEVGKRVRAGQEVRLLEIRAVSESGEFGVFDDAGPLGDAAALAGQVKRESHTFYGSAGPAFVAEIASRFDEVRDDLAQMKEHFIRSSVPQGADGQVHRAAERFALIAAAGEMATQLGIVAWEPGEAIAAAQAIFAEWIAARGGAGAKEELDAVVRVREFLAAHGETRFDPVDSSDFSKPALNRVG